MSLQALKKLRNILNHFLQILKKGTGELLMLATTWTYLIVSEPSSWRRALQSEPEN